MRLLSAYDGDYPSRAFPMHDTPDKPQPAQQPKSRYRFSSFVILLCFKLRVLASLPSACLKNAWTDFNRVLILPILQLFFAALF